MTISRTAYCRLGTSTTMHLPPELSVFLLSMLPLTELRGALPLALTYYHMPVVRAIALTVFGNIIPGVVLLYVLDPVSRLLRKKSRLCNRLLPWLFARTRNKFTQKYERWGEAALAVFVAIPLPVTGAWTGAVAAYLFDIPRYRAVLSLLVGLCISGGIVAGVTLGIFHLISL